MPQNQPSAWIAKPNFVSKGQEKVSAAHYRIVSELVKRKIDNSVYSIQSQSLVNVPYVQRRNRAFNASASGFRARSI